METLFFICKNVFSGHFFDAFNFLASLINGNPGTGYQNINHFSPFNFLASLINGNLDSTESNRTNEWLLTS
jgi:hypothetical protein